MSQTLSRVLIHYVFSTRNRESLITPDIESDLYAYMGGICRAHDSSLLSMGGMPDHVHMLVVLGRKISMSDLMMEVKKDSSKWIKTRGREFSGFHWQDGYGAFSIGESQRNDILRYIATQKEHHKTRTFKEELVALLERYGVEYDPEHIWT
ncbi:MAG: IS200/IS605 family transposase [Phycisphaeraceae bacterium]|nr:IS200/IS605 family transposase [Phycisphaeraceae bacterium]MBX3368080.1 IS200/IS605 family transposase [Phycisphaeraceae bacterium]